MADRPNYTLDESPEYSESIPVILNEDKVNAETVVNPLILRILNNIKAVYKALIAAKSASVPITRKISDHELTSDVTLTATDVGARPSTWTPSASDVGAVPLTQKGVANGISTLDSSGKIPKSQLPTTGGYVRQTTAPTDTSLLWMDSGHSDIMKYYNGTAWTPQPSVWGPET